MTCYSVAECKTFPVNAKMPHAFELRAMAGDVSAAAAPSLTSELFWVLDNTTMYGLVCNSRYLFCFNNSFQLGYLQ